MIKMNNILGAGTFPKEPEKAGLLAAQDTMETLGAHCNSRDELGGHFKSLLYTTEFILRVLIFKIRSNNCVIRKHNSVLRCYILGRVFLTYDLKSTLLRVCFVEVFTPLLLSEDSFWELLPSFHCVDPAERAQDLRWMASATHPQSHLAGP